MTLASWMLWTQLAEEKLLLNYHRNSESLKLTDYDSVKLVSMGWRMAYTFPLTSSLVFILFFYFFSFCLVLRHRIISCSFSWQMSSYFKYVWQMSTAKILLIQMQLCPPKLCFPKPILKKSFVFKIMVM